MYYHIQKKKIEIKLGGKVDRSCKTHTGLYTTTQYRLLKLRVDIWQYREVGKKWK